MTRYVYHADVISVYEKKNVVSGRKVGDETVIQTESEGWFIRVTDSSAISVGREKPDIVVGDKMRITMEKI